MLKKFILFLFLINSLNILFSDSTGDLTYDETQQRINDIFQYGIDSEVISLFSDLGPNPKAEIYPKLILRYKNARLNLTKIEFIKYFSKLSNAPDEIIDLVYYEASSDNLNKEFNVALLSCLGKIGKYREALLLLDRINSNDLLIQTTAAEALSNMKVPEIAKQIIDRLIESDSNYDKFLSSEIKCKLIHFLGNVKSQEAKEYLRKLISDKTNDKFILMYSMVALAKIEDFDSIKIMEENLDHIEPKVQEYAALSISLIKNPVVEDILLKMLLHNNENVRIYALQGIVLNNFKSAIKNIVYKFKFDPSIKVQKEALSSLLYFQDEGINEIKKYFEKNKITYDKLTIISDAIVKKTDEYNVSYIVQLYNETDKKGKEVIANRIIYATSNKIDPIIKLLLESDNYLIRMGGLKAFLQIENSSLIDKVKEISEKDPVNSVKDYAKKILLLKK